MKNKTKIDQSTNKKLFVMNPGQLNVKSMIDWCLTSLSR